MLRVAERRATQAEVAEHLGLGLRQVERLFRAYKAGGVAALASKKRGRPSLRRLPKALRDHAIELVRTHYADFGPTLAHERLAERHGLTTVSVETLRQWMTAEGLWRPRRERAARPFAKGHVMNSKYPGPPRASDQVANRLMRRLGDLGYDVSGVVPKAAA
jgi:transposase